ncbi:hypothetical protein TSOC_005626 [Tetrabaena socialis]|uniref:Uncharacterized protein n=1 Tax=Tetrabaena socialis TaxID=47790 RepID=A0A2J8A5T3_9CHLO|nr:hypothetical protein TSOC_005626 [Tetrabaena socialis]|eukprot:PNH07860.1 hypothetical protein TSOC_005626 [Tetrabaena socialis]
MRRASAPVRALTDVRAAQETREPARDTRDETTERYKRENTPGQLSKPEKVWSSSSALIIGFYQAAPYSDTFRIFYKKTGAGAGKQRPGQGGWVTLTPASILGPEMAVRQPVTGEVQYFEYEIKKLKPSTQYVIKIKTSDDASEVRSDKMGSVSLEEERTRDNDMRNFVGALVKLGDYDGLILSYAPPTGIFSVRILQLDDIASSLQLARLSSDYSDSGVPVQAYTLSQIRFGRWGGAITGSKVVNEGELKWLVARAVQMGDKSEAAAAYEARQRLLQAQVEKVTAGLESEWGSRFRAVRLRAMAYLLLLSLVVLAAGGGGWSVLGRSGRRQRELLAQLAESRARLGGVEAELQMLHLYRVSLELDMERRLAATATAAGDVVNATHGDVSYSSNSSSGSGLFGGAAAAVAAAFGGTEGGRNGTSDGGGGSGAPAVAAAGARKPVLAAQQRQGEQPGSQAARGGGGRSGGGGGKRVEGGSGRAQAPGARSRGAAGPGGRGGGRKRARGEKQAAGSHAAAEGRGEGGGGSQAGGGKVGGPAELWNLPNQALWRAMSRSRLARTEAEVARGRGGSGEPYGDVGDDADPQQPDAWTFIHYVSHVYAMYLQEWMKVQLQTTVRRKVNEMLLVQPPEIAAAVGADEAGGAAAANSSVPGGGGGSRQRRRSAEGGALGGDHGGEGRRHGGSGRTDGRGRGGRGGAVGAACDEHGGDGCGGDEEGYWDEYGEGYEGDEYYS